MNDQIKLPSAGKIAIKYVTITITSIATVIIMSLLLAFPIMWMWNYIFTPATTQALFGIAKLTFWKTLWFGVLCGILIKGSSK